MLLSESGRTHRTFKYSGVLIFSAQDYLTLKVKLVQSADIHKDSSQFSLVI